MKNKAVLRILVAGLIVSVLVVYDLANNQAQVIAHTGYKRLPVTYDKDHVYLGGVDVVEYFKTLVVPTKDYYAS